MSIALSSWRDGRRTVIAALLLGGVLSGCAATPTDPAARAAFEQTNDPLEPLNRKTFAFNLFVDHWLFRPVAKTYVTVVPDDARHAIHHVLDNMKEPTLFFNNVLQGEFKRAEITFRRFLVNSTVGFGGLVDVMALSGIERQPADFGQTLYVWGAPSGPYLVLPILGPSNPRDAIGGGVDSYADPATILAKSEDITDLLTYRFVVGGIDERAQVLDVLDDLEKNSVDFYAQLRSLSQQHRDAELRHGKAPETTPGLYEDPGKPAGPAPAPPAPAKPGAMQAPTQRIANTSLAPLPPPAKPAAMQAHRARTARLTAPPHHPSHRQQIGPKRSKIGRVTPCAARRCVDRAV